MWSISQYVAIFSHANISRTGLYSFRSVSNIGTLACTLIWKFQIVRHFCFACCFDGKNDKNVLFSIEWKTWTFRWKFECWWLEFEHAIVLIISNIWKCFCVFLPLHELVWSWLHGDMSKIHLSIENQEPLNFSIVSVTFTTTQIDWINFKRNNICFCKDASTRDFFSNTIVSLSEFHFLVSTITTVQLL